MFLTQNLLWMRLMTQDTTQCIIFPKMLKHICASKF
uniref:Uncharacterized protein n=1 Tax=Arundo donax TaxID=35708 RepID=A0A0A8Y6F2_ARUDO